MTLEIQIQDLNKRVSLLEQILSNLDPKSLSCNGLNLVGHIQPADARGYFLPEISQDGKNNPLTQPYCKTELSPLAKAECNRGLTYGIPQANLKLQDRD